MEPDLEAVDNLDWDKALTRLMWAPYEEPSCDPDRSQESMFPPDGPIIIGAVAYRGEQIIIYWKERNDQEG